MHRIICYIMSLLLYLSLSDGYIALWKDGETEPIKVYPYHISLFPKIDQNRLKKGIPIESEEEFSKHIEDYLS